VKARQVCAGCPVLVECRESALAEEAALPRVWGRGWGSLGVPGRTHPERADGRCRAEARGGLAQDALSRTLQSAPANAAGSCTPWRHRYR